MFGWRPPSSRTNVCGFAMKTPISSQQAQDLVEPLLGLEEDEGDAADDDRLGVVRDRIAAHHLRVARGPLEVEQDLAREPPSKLGELLAEIGPEARLEVGDRRIRLDRPERRVVPRVVRDERRLRRDPRAAFGTRSRCPPLDASATTSSAWALSTRRNETDSPGLRYLARGLK